MIRGVLLSFFVFLSYIAFCQLNTGSPTVPFGSNNSYEYGMMPTNLPSGETYGQSSDVASVYVSWKSTYVENCGDDQARVRFDDPSFTVSEGIAYGMLVAVYAGDKDLFDRLWAFYKNNTNQNGVMNWKIQGCSNGTTGQNGATDAELDAAMALIVATKQWPNSTFPHNYQTDGSSLISAIKNHETANDGTFYNGDMWHPNCRNPSYQAPAYAKAFGIFTNDSFWDNVVSGTENLFENNAHPSSGLSTNWCTPTGGISDQCEGSGTSYDSFGYDACRAPWRQGVDVLWWGVPATGNVQTVIDRQASFWENKGGAGSVQGGNNLKHDGSGSGDHNGAFTGMIGAMSLGASSSHQSFCNDLYTENLKSSMDNGYFTAILRILGLFVQTGNFWNPYASEVIDENENPTVSLTSPSNSFSVCEGIILTLSASASDSDGQIQKVEFYEGSNLLTSDNNAPYSYNWSNTTSGNKTITAIAYDNEGGTTISSEIDIIVNTTPSAPNATNQQYCLNENGQQLQANGENLQWYTQLIGGDLLNNAPTPQTNIAGIVNYYVSQSTNGCESERTEVQTEIVSVDLPTVVSSVNYCQNQSPIPLQANGEQLLWYTQSNGGNSSNSVPTPETSNLGNISYYVSQTIGGCESERNEIIVSVGLPTATPFVDSNIQYCQYEESSELTAQGQNLLWYTDINSDDGSINPFIPSTEQAGMVNYYVSQEINGCESDKAIISVLINQSPEIPSVSNYVYALNTQVDDLTAQGDNLLWYVSLSGEGLQSAPTISSSEEGITNYYVTQSNENGCESKKANIVVTITDALMVGKTTVKPVIDGNVDDIWNVIEGQVFENVIQGSISNDNDLSGNFKVMWDNDYFYVLGQINDDQQINDGGNAYQDDAIEVYFDYGNHKLSTYETGDAQFTFRWNDNIIGVNNNASTQGIEYQMVATTSGYNYEARFPWNTIGGIANQGDLHGFEFQVNDDDDNNDRDGKLAWEATTDDAWNNPSLLGDIILGEEIILCNQPELVNIIVENNGQFCEGDEYSLFSNQIEGVSYQWYYNNMIIQGETSSKLSIFESGDYSIKIYDSFIEDPNCYLLSDLHTVEKINLPLFNIEYNDTIYCPEGEELFLEGSFVENATYQWTGQVESEEQVINNIGVGNYVLTVSVQGCQASDSIDIVEGEIPNPEIIGPDKACIYNDTEVYMYEAHSFDSNSYLKWSTDNAVIIAGDQEENMNIELSTGNGTTIQLTETVNSGCSGTTSKYVEYECPNGTYNKSNYDNSVVYPNPFVDVLNIEGYTQYQLLDLNGKILIEGNIENNEIQLFSIPEATYLLKVINTENVNFIKITKK